MTTDTVSKGEAPASQLPEPDTAAKLSDRGRGGQQLSATAPEASTRQAGGASGDPSPSPTGTSPLRLRTRPRIKSDSFGSAAVHRRKHSNNAESGADNRRVAIVPLRVDAAQARPVPAREDETDRYTPSITDAAQATLPSPSAGRRGFVVDAQLAASGSALVAPPDTNLSSHDFYFSSPSLTPSPPSSPPSLSPTTPKFPRSPPSPNQEIPRQARSLAHSRTPSRDIGIVGTLTRLELPQHVAALGDTPIFQTLSSRSSSSDILSTPIDTISVEPDALPQTSSSSAAHVHRTAMSTSVEPILTTSPAMNVHGIHAQPHSPHTLPVPSSRHQLAGTTEKGQASPAAAPSTSTAPPSYLYYQPGVHSKAGPLPPPPRAMFDIDFNAPPPPRPPRLRSPSPLTSQKSPGAAVTTSVTVRLDPKASTPSIHQVQINPPPPVSTGSSSGDSEHPPEPATGPSNPDLAVHHSREGAFPPSTILVSPPERLHSLPNDPNRHVQPPPPKDQLPNPPTDPVPTTIAQPSNDECSPSTSRSPELLPENSSVSNSNDASPNSPESSRRAFEDTRRDVPQEPNGSCPIIREFAAEDSPLEAKRKGGVLTSLKRYSSLPRTPSVKSQRMSIVTRSPSPESPPRRRIRTRSPDAMRFKDILNKRSALERAIGYANKINELSTYDCGLGDWVVSMKERGSSKTRLVPPPSPSQNSNSPLAPRPRHTSRTSISSEVTFALRADSYIATDLSQRDIDTVPSSNVPPPALPYPALAGVPPPINFRHSTTTMGSQSPLTVPLSAGAKATGSFFSSLGRNASMMRRDSTKPAQHARLTKPPPGVSTSAPNPRPVQITNAPSVPGGPRALPNRVQRSRTLMLAPSPTKANADATSSSSSPLTRRRSNTLKRPSFFGRSHGPGPSPERGAPTSAEFTQQIDRLADLLPHADRDVLAGYLRRAGQDILAIGQYLEDEKNGTVRRD